VAELRVEGGHARNLGRGDLGDLADAPQRLLGQVPELLLEALKDGDDRLGLSPRLLDKPVNEGQVNLLAVGWG